MTAAAISNLLLEAAIVAYGGAVFAFVAEIVLAGRSRRIPAATERQLVATGAPVGATDVSLTGPGVADPAGGDERWSGRGERIGRVALALVTSAIAFHLGAIVARGIAAGRPPWGNMYEFAVVGAFIVASAFVILQRRYDVRFLGVWVSALVLIVLGFAITVLYTEATSLLPALRSTWLVIHVLAAIVATGLFTLGAVVSALFLYVDRRTRAGRPLGSYAARLPDRESLDRLAFRLHAAAFPVWTFAVMAGAVWAQYAWGRYWGWDPKETWAFVSWVVYAAYLHARLTAGWRGRAAAAVAMVGYATMLFNFIGVNIFFSGFHTYSGL
jgi:cytochrome c-type biogenesis protein CcsB